jgi:ABC-type branched-subunit amino acid transport system substrate-binding protein
MLQKLPNAKRGMLYQNDDFGKDYPAGVKDVLGAKYDKMVIATSYEATDPTVDSQVAQLHAAGTNVILVAAIPKFATGDPQGA